MTSPLDPDMAQRIRRLAGDRHAPFYLYAADGIRRIARQFRDLPWPNTAIHVATMANENPDILRLLRESGLNVFVNSLPHLELAHRVGYEGEEIVFTASAMDERTMRTVRGSGALTNLDSLGEVSAWRRLFPGAPVGLRCNIGELAKPRKTRAGYFLGRESRLGLLLHELEELYGEPWVEGLHVYVGTDLLDIEYFRECYESLALLAPRFPALRYLDFGGGFGVPTAGEAPFDFKAYGTMVADVMGAISGKVGRPLRMILEPGRIIGAEAGYFVTRIVDVKRRGAQQLLGVNASVAQFPRPLFYSESAYHPVTLLLPESQDIEAHVALGQRPGGALRSDGGGPKSPADDEAGGHDACGAVDATVPTDVYGCSTYSRDYLARNVLLPEAKPGDFVVFGLAGSYCASAFTCFLGFPRPEEILA